MALLAGALKHCGIECTVVDANALGLSWLGKNRKFSDAKDLWTQRAVSHYDRYVDDLRHSWVYGTPDRYRQRIMDVNRVIGTAVDDRFRVSLSDYTDTRLKPVNSRDLIAAATAFQENPFYGFFTEELAPVIQASGSDYVGISVCFLSQALTAFALAGWIRAQFPGRKIIMGGGLITSWMSHPGWSNPFDGIVDLLVSGEGEKPLLALAGADQASLGKYLPDFDFCQWDSYLAPGRILPFRTSTGCYWGKCGFCPEKAEKNGYRPGRKTDIMDTLLQLYDRYRPDYVHFLDNAVSPGFLRAMTTMEMPFAWYGFVRFTRDLADPEFCRALYRSGCRMLNLGLESGDQRVLEAMNKGTDTVLASRVLKAVHQAGIATYVYLLFGTPAENLSSAEITLEYVAAHSEEIDFLNVAVFNLPRFSPEANDLETDSFYEGDLSLYLNFRHPLGWDRKAVRRFLSRRFKKEPAIAAILRRDPPFFTSNHAMFLR